MCKENAHLIIQPAENNIILTLKIEFAVLKITIKNDCFNDRFAFNFNSQ